MTTLAQIIVVFAFMAAAAPVAQVAIGWLKLEGER